MKTLACALLAMGSLLTPESGQAAAAEPPPLRVLFLTGGPGHHYEKMVPFLTDRLAKIASFAFDVRSNPGILKGQDFAAPYDLLVFDTVIDHPPAIIENSVKAIANGKPAVMIHDGIRAFGPCEDWGHV